MIGLHSNATPNMRGFFFEFMYRSQEGRIDRQNSLHNRRMLYNYSIVNQYKSAGDVDTDLELQKIYMLNIIADQLLNPNFSTRAITKLTAYQSGIISELDSGVAAHYSSRNYIFFEPDVNYI